MIVEPKIKSGFYIYMLNINLIKGYRRNGWKAMDRIFNPVPLHPSVIGSILVKNPIRM